jgi:hypothetical protein
MIKILLNRSFTFDHCELPAGMVIAVPAEKARELIQRGVAQTVEPERAVIEPRETRTRKR